MRVSFGHFLYRRYLHKYYKYCIIVKRFLKTHTMQSRKTLNPSRHFSAAILGIGIVSLFGALLFSHAMDSVQMKVSAAQQTCSGGLEMCMKSAENNSKCQACIKSDATITSSSCQACASVKAACQYIYNACTDEGGNIHAW